LNYNLADLDDYNVVIIVLILSGRHQRNQVNKVKRCAL